MNAVGQQSHSRKHYTVAELLAREASGVRTPYHREREVPRPRAPLSVTELLRREGVDFAGESNPTVELPVSAPVHVTKLLQRENELADPGQKRRPHRIAAIGSAAALCGLTIAGLIALKPTTALSPGGLADDSNQPAGSSPSQEDTIKPTTTVLQRASSSKSTTGASDPTTPVAAGAQGNSSNQSNGAAQRPTGSPDSPGSAPTTQPSTLKPTATSEPSPRSPAKEQPRTDDGDAQDGLLDPIMGPVTEVLDPVVGTVTGTLDGLLG